MAQDYHIYIHDESSGSSQLKQKTQPNSLVGKTNPTQSNQAKKNIKQAMKIAQNPDSALSEKKLVGIASAAKGGIVALAIYAGIKITDKVIGTISPIVATKSGDYNFVHTYQNFKSAVNMMFNPVGTLINEYKFSVEKEVENQKKQLQNDLLGDAYISARGRGFKV